VSVSSIVRRFTPLLQLILVSAAAHIALTGSRVTTSLYALSLHASEFTVGTLIALFALFPMIFAVPMGRLIDRIGIVKPMIGGALLMFAGCIIPSVLDGLPLLYPSVVMIGTGFMATHISSQHAVGAMSLSETRSTNFSWLALGYSVSSFLGPVIAGFVIEHVRYSIAYAVFCGFTFLAVTLAGYGNLNRIRLAPHPDGQQSKSAFGLLRNPEMRRIYAISILLGSAWDLFMFIMPIHGSHLGFSASTIGLILGCFSCATFAVRLAMHWISRRYSEWQVLTTALSLAVICYVLFPFMKNPLAIMIVTTMLGLALGSSQPNVLALLHHVAPDGRAGEAVGVRVTISNASQVLLPLAFGAAGATLGLFAVFWGMGVMIGSGVPIAWRKAYSNASAADKNQEQT
jgi:MFS family permease